MKSKFLKTILLAGLTLSYQALAAQVKLRAAPDPPDTGTNTLLIEVLDDSGKSLPTAQVALLVYMPAMGTMPYMERKTQITSKGAGNFVATYDIPMAGSWELTLTVTTGGKNDAYHYSVTTGIPGVASKDADERLNSQTTSDRTILNVGRERLQTIGVRFAPVKRQRLTREIRAVGIVEQDKTHREELTLRVSGYLAKQFKGRVGDHVDVGAPLFSVYSPELITAESEFLLADQLAIGGPMHKAAAERLANLGLSLREIEQIRKAREPLRDMVIRSPITGTILEVNAREGAAIGAGQVVYVVGDLSKSYIIARVFQQDVSDLSTGLKASIVIPSVDGPVIPGRIDLVFPQVEPGAGTTNIRVEAITASPNLRPGTYVDTRFAIDAGEHLVIPAEAVLYSGLHRYVFVDRGNGALEPREVATGRVIDDLIEIEAGLAENEQVVASGTFLLGSEAQIRSALPKWRDGAAANGSGG